MKRKISEEIAFFNLLKGLVAPKLKNEAVNYKISIEDLADKMEIDKMIISNFLLKLQGEGLIKILEDINDEVSLHFERTHDKLLEIVTTDKIEEKIFCMSDFIDEKIGYFNLNDRNKYTPKYALEIKELIDKEGEDADLRDIISRGIREILSSEENENEINKIIFQISKDATENDLEILEEIIYYNLNLPVEENPFYVTLFLTAVSYHLQYL